MTAWYQLELFEPEKKPKKKQYEMKFKNPRMNKGLFSSAKCEWETPQEFFDQLDEEFGFELDVCALPENAKCERYFTPEQDGLKQDWSRPYAWIQELIPLESLERAHSLVQILSLGQHIGGDSLLAEGAAPIGLCELDSQLRLFPLDTEVRQEKSQDVSRFLARDIPSPRDALIEFARLFGGDSADFKHVHKEIYRRLMYHLDSESQEVIRRAFLPARGLSSALLDVYAAFSIKKPCAISEGFTGNHGHSTSTPSCGCAFHTLIVPRLEGFIKDCLNQNPCIAWCNPPYGREIGKWIRKAYESSQKGATVVCLIPSRTDARWWHEYVMKAAEVRFVRGRIRFGGSKENAPFPSCVVVFRQTDQPTRFSSMEQPKVKPC